jgi:hypothetical protein
VNFSDRAKQGDSLLDARIVGREDSAIFGSDSREEIRWIGKPWRRVELLTHRTFWKGEEIDTTRDLSFHLGLRRLGFGVTLSFAKATVLDYGEERQ